MENFNWHILKLLYKKRKFIIIVTLLGAALSVVLTTPMFIKPKFKSVGTVFPANLAPVSDETPTEQLMQFFSSQEVKMKLFKNFNLAKHYNLDTTSDRLETYYTYMYEENIKISETRYGSIELQVLDTDPKMAQKLVYGLIDAVNQHIRICKNSKTEEFNKMNKYFYENRRRKMDSTEIILKKLSAEYGLLDFFIQIEQASKSYYRAIPDGKSEKLETKMKALGEKGVEYMTLMEQYKIYMGDYNASKQDYEKGLRDVNKKFTYTTLASTPNLPEIKTFPKRSVFAVVGTLASFIFICLFFIVMDRFKDIKSKLDKE